MIVLEKKKALGSDSGIIALFGAGLIGSSIYEAIIQRGNYQIIPMPFEWNNLEQCRNDAEGILKLLTRLLQNSLQNGCASPAMAFVWSAGKAGFTASEKCMEEELTCFMDVLTLVQRIMEKFPAINFFFHHISSVGGLFEGQKLVDCQSCPVPKRFYGLLKYKQESLLLQQDSLLKKTIYRPTSVYGVVNNRNRMGLIPTLIVNGIQNKVSTIFGNLSTLRDYVFSHDIAFFISESLFTCPISPSVPTYFLGSGKPSSIYEIRHCIEKIIGKKIYLEFRSTFETENTSDITINSSALPLDWKFTELTTGIRFVKERILL